MRFPKLREGSQYRVTIPALCGGVNLNDAPNLVEDDQLTDVKNMWWKDQALRTRPGLALGDHHGFVNQDIQVFDRDISKTMSSAEAPDYGRYAVRSMHSAGETAVYMDFIHYDGTIDISADGAGIGQGNVTFNLLYTNGSVTVDGYKPDFLLFCSDGRIRMPYETKDESGLKDITEQAYAPLVMVNGTPCTDQTEAAPNGTFFEGYNTLTPKFRAWYSSDGTGNYYGLPATKIDPGHSVCVEYTHKDGTVFRWECPPNQNNAPAVTIEGVRVGFHVDREPGVFFFTTTNSIYTLPRVAKNNLCIEAYCAAEKAHPETVCGMTLSTWFGGDRSGTTGGTRLFMSGHPAHPGLMHWSDINNPLYFPENNYAYIGDSSYPVTAFGKQQNILVIFKENEMFYAEYVAGSPYTAEDVIDGRVADVTAYAATFPITPINSYVGCSCPGTVQLCNNHLVWAAGDGHIYTLASPNSYNQRNVQAISQMVEPLFTAFSYDDWKKARAVNYRGHYLLQVADKAFLFNYGDSGFVNSSSYYKSDAAQRNIAWYVWDFHMEGIEWFYLMAKENRCVLLGSSSENVVTYVLDGSIDFDEVNPRWTQSNEFCTDERKIPCVFQTKVFDFGSPDRNKFIRRLHLGAADTADGFMSLAYITEDGVQEDVCRIGAYGDGKMREWAMTPGVNRVRQFGIRAESDGNMAVDNMVLKYEVNGEVR